MPDVVIGFMVYMVYTHQETDVSTQEKVTAASLPDKTQPLLHDDTQKQQDVAAGKLSSVSVFMFSGLSVRKRREKTSHL